MADLGHVDADLMRSTCLRPAFHQCIVACFFYRPHMGCGMFARVWQSCTAADAVATVADKASFDGLLFNVPMYYG
jgi:hypothetical protein